MQFEGESFRNEADEQLKRLRRIERENRLMRRKHSVEGVLLALEKERLLSAFELNYCGFPGRKMGDTLRRPQKVQPSCPRDHSAARSPRASGLSRKGSSLRKQQRQSKTRSQLKNQLLKSKQTQGVFRSMAQDEASELFKVVLQKEALRQWLTAAFNGSVAESFERHFQVRGTIDYLHFCHVLERFVTLDHDELVDFCYAALDYDKDGSLSKEDLFNSAVRDQSQCIVRDCRAITGSPPCLHPRKNTYRATLRQARRLQAKHTAKLDSLYICTPWVAEHSSQAREQRMLGERARLRAPPAKPEVSYSAFAAVFRNCPPQLYLELTQVLTGRKKARSPPREPTPPREESEEGLGRTRRRKILSQLNCTLSRIEDAS